MLLRTPIFARHVCHVAGKQQVLGQLLKPCQTVMVVPSANMFWEPDRKGGYVSEPEQPKWQMIKDGFKALPKELKIFKEEMTEKFQSDEAYAARDGDYQYFWKFGGADSLADWLVTMDRDHAEGKSQAELTLSKNNKALFRGHLCQDVPKDGIQKKTGYCNIRSPSNMKSFKRKKPYDWSRYSHLILRVRGDGRTYMLTVAMDMFYDINWNDQFHFPLYTRGGPYWQTAKIPLSKFYLASKGRIQDKQERMLTERVYNLGISIGDGVEGPFSLEIDYIGGLFDANYDEDFAYEMYKADKRHVGQ